MDILLQYIKLEMERYQINNGIIINLLEQNIMIRKMEELIIVQFKTSYKNKI